jgi:FKBP-type peptidyl-prolyl cis-trans isomerase 2
LIETILGCPVTHVAYDARNFGEQTMVDDTLADGTGRAEAFRVGPGMHVRLDYRVRDAEGEAVGPDLERLEVTFGMGQLLPVVEQTIDGLAAGESKQLRLLASDAYGPRNPDAVLEVEREEFPSDVVPGDYFEVENADAGLLVLRILEVGEDFVLVDMNHPLAGQDLDVEVVVLEVRPATRQELEWALQVGASDDRDEQSPLISPDRLLRGHARR